MRRSGVLAPTKRLLILPALVLAWTSLALVDPSWSCGCGAMVTSGPAMAVNQETSIVRYDERSRREQILMRLSVRSTATDAAWLFPTPAPAKVTLGERAWFGQLDTLTRPRVVKRYKWWGRPGGDGAVSSGGAPTASRGGVRVLSEQRLGPFEVATLASGDSQALAGWLEANGYKLSPTLKSGLQPYVDRKWSFVAVKLAPESGRSLSGDLDPLLIDFRSDELVYPMQLSRLAATSQSVHLYVLGAHRVEHQGPRGSGFGVSFAGWVEPGQVSSPGLKRFLGGRMFLTEVLNTGLTPSEITDDFRYTYTADVPHREIDYDTEYVTFLGVPAGWVILGGGVFLVTGVVAGVAILIRRRTAGGGRPPAAG